MEKATGEEVLAALVAGVQVVMVVAMVVQAVAGDTAPAEVVPAAMAVPEVTAAVIVITAAVAVARNFKLLPKAIPAILKQSSKDQHQPARQQPGKDNDR